MACEMITPLYPAVRNTRTRTRTITTAKMVPCLLTEIKDDENSFPADWNMQIVTRAMAMKSMLISCIRSIVTPTVTISACVDIIDFLLTSMAGFASCPATRGDGTHRSAVSTVFLGGYSDGLIINESVPVKDSRLFHTSCRPLTDAHGSN